MAVELDTIGQIESEMKRAAAKASGGNANFFVLKDGEKALVRCLLNLSAIAIIRKHDFFNSSTKKFEVNAICAEQPELEIQGKCKHCANAKDIKKLTAVKYFIIPVWVYGIKNAQGQPVTYTDQNDQSEKPVQGLRYLQLKATSDILSTLLELYREGTDLTTLDLTISRKGESLDTKYTTLPRPTSAFTVENIPAQDKYAIVQRIAELNPPETIDAADVFNIPPAQSSASSKKSVPDF